MRLRDVLTVSFEDLPAEAMATAGRILSRDGVDAAKSDPTCDRGKPMVADADDDALETSAVLAGIDLQYLLVLDRSRLIGLIDAVTLRDLRRRSARGSVS